MLPSEVFPQATPQALEPDMHWLMNHAICPDTGKLILPIQSYVVQTPQHTILIDTCIGCGKVDSFNEWNDRDDDTWLRNLAAAGFTPEDIDYVFCTHLHSDHTGWNTRLLDDRWVPTFPNAKYILSKVEVAKSEATGSNTYKQNVLPIIEAGQAELVETDFALNDMIHLVPTPGHTVGHVCVHIQSGGQNAILIGDTIHSPIQLAHPDWSMIFDDDMDMAAATRIKLFDNLCETDTLVFTAHLPSPSAGHIVTHPDRPYDFSYVDKD
jgi:glyoxylase-like metal-dependent hydrolase (beta-lactamase superfamily II)